MFKDYNKCIKYLYSLERAGIKYDLKNIRTILKFLGNPEKRLNAIHIAGTNGKGSVASIINSVLLEYGFKCGLYTSPHIKDFRERILLNGKMIDKKFVIEFTNKLNPLIKKISPSFFEVTTAMAFEYFAVNKVDYAIIEAGLGGRLDSTNVLKPLISIITGISIDHREYLGDTIEDIAREKAGIIKNNIPVITGKLNPKLKEIIFNTAVKRNSGFYYSPDITKIRIMERLETGFNFKYGNDVFYSPVIGDYQKINISAAITSMIAILKRENRIFDKIILSNGFHNLARNSNFYGRFQIIKDFPKIIIDVSHNAEGIKNIKNNLKYVKYRKLYIIFGMMEDKEYRKCLREIENLGGYVILTKPKYKRALEPEEMYKIFRNKTNCIVLKDVKRAYKYAMNKAGKDDAVLITGSFYLVGEVIKVISCK
ncbi:MAG: bifunctional folylpolyglutamate synthase/dihydrofolate synthase [Ignavibacteria bacterium]|nr:bifunctional folylpolyglutamate synthase/dihydrofolate synthase [Ignavibacteria bacterium]